MKKWMIALGMMMLSSSAVFAGDATAGKANYVICATCHGQNAEGLVAMNAPALAGQETWYLERQLKNYKAGIRGKDSKNIFGLQMQPMAMTLADDTAIENVAAYINSLPTPKQPLTVKGDAAKGKALYTICSTCHGQSAEGNLALNAPRLTGLQDWYQVRQLTLYKDGVRGTDAKDVFGMQMKPMAMTLTNEQAILDVVAYISSLQK